MDRQVGSHLAQHPDHTQILHQHRVYAQLRGQDSILSGLLHFPVRDQGVQGEV